jgi:hypothetical protein
MLVNKSVGQSKKVPQSSVKPKQPKKLETTDKQDKLIGTNVFEFFVDNLDSSTKETFLSFAADKYSVIEIYIYARFLGYAGSITDCLLWVEELFDKPDHVKTLLYQIQEMNEDIRKLREDVENGLVKRDVGVARNAQMQRELRGNIAQVEVFTNNRDRKGLLMSGADRALRELAQIFKDDPIAIPLEEASMAVWARMQLEE